MENGEKRKRENTKRKENVSKPLQSAEYAPPPYRVPPNMLLNTCLQFPVPMFPPSCQWAWGISVISAIDLLSHVAYSHGILAGSERSVSQLQVCHQWHSTSSRLLHLRRTMNTFSASVVTSILARETVLRHHWSAECFKVKLEVSIWTALTVNWQTSTYCVCLIMLKWLWLTVLSHYAELI